MLIPQSTNRTITSQLFLALVFLLVFLPTGSIWGINIKLIALGVFLAAFVWHSIVRRNAFTSHDLIVLLLVVSFLDVLALIAFLRGRAETLPILQELQDIASTILIAWLARFVVRRGLVSEERFATTVVYSAVAIAAAKIGLIVATLLGYLDLYETVQSVFGMSFVTGPIPFGLFRCQIPTDILGPFVIFAMFAPSVSGVRVNWAVKLGGSTILLASAFVAFSRYLWLLYGVAAFIAMVVERRWKTLAGVALVLSVIAVLNRDMLGSVTEARFLSADSSASDDLRRLQTSSLLEEFESNPVFGKGIGTHAPGIIREPKFVYSYELQWLALLMQVGIVGVSVIGYLVYASARDLIMTKHVAKPWVALMFVLWLLSGFTNPYMTTSFAAVVFALFMAMFLRMRKLSGQLVA